MSRLSTGKQNTNENQVVCVPMWAKRVTNSLRFTLQIDRQGRGHRWNEIMMLKCRFGWRFERRHGVVALAGVQKVDFREVASCCLRAIVRWMFTIHLIWLVDTAVFARGIIDEHKRLRQLNILQCFQKLIEFKKWFVAKNLLALREVPRGGIHCAAVVHRWAKMAASGLALNSNRSVK